MFILDNFTQVLQQITTHLFVQDFLKHAQEEESYYFNPKLFLVGIVDIQFQKFVSLNIILNSNRYSRGLFFIMQQ